MKLLDVHLTHLDRVSEGEASVDNRGVDGNSMSQQAACVYTLHLPGSQHRFEGDAVESCHVSHCTRCQGGTRRTSSQFTKFHLMFYG